MSQQEPAPAVLVIGHDADALAALARRKQPGIELALAGDAREAVRVHAGQRVLFGSPQAIAAALPEIPDVAWVQSTWAGVTPLVELDRRGTVQGAGRGTFAGRGRTRPGR